MDGSMQNYQELLALRFPSVYLYTSTKPTGLAYGCRKWVRDVLALSGTQYTVRNWQKLCSRGRKLNIRLATYSKRSQLP